MAAYAIIFAFEVCTQGHIEVETMRLFGDNCMTASMGFDRKETSTQTRYQIGAGVFQALAKEKDLQRSAWSILPLAPVLLFALFDSIRYMDMSAP